MNNWFLLLTSGANTWAQLEAEGISPSEGALRFVGQVPTLVRTEGVIDGGGEIGDFVESNLVAFYDVLGYVTSDFTARYQVLAPVNPVVGTVRLVGQVPTLSFAWTRSPTVGRIRLTGQVPTVTGPVDVEVSPSAGLLRLIGNAPFLQPVFRTPATGTFRITGLAPEISRFVYPSAGTVRLVGWGAVVSDLTATYTVFSSYVTSDFTAFWQRAGFVTSDFTAAWALYGRVGNIRVLPVANRIIADTPTLPTIRAVAVQNRIYAKRAA